VPVLTADRHTHPRADEGPEGHGHQVGQGARGVAGVPAALDGDGTGQCPEPGAAEEADGDTVTSATRTAHARSRADVKPGAGLARDVHAFPVLTPHDDGRAIDGFEPADHAQTGDVVVVHHADARPDWRTGVSCAPKAPSGRASATATQRNTCVMVVSRRERRGPVSSGSQPWQRASLSGTL